MLERQQIKARWKSEIIAEPNRSQDQIVENLNKNIKTQRLT